MVEAPKQEQAEPIVNNVAVAERLFYAYRYITANRLGKSQGVEFERPLFLRNKRAELYRQLLPWRHHWLPTKYPALKEISSEARDRDEIARQYLNQGEVKVSLPNLGEQMARYVILTPPEGRRTAETYHKPPIFVIPGISNDLDCIGSFINELAFQGRRVICVAYPESNMGSITPEFAQAVRKNPGFEVHSQFYKGAIEALYPEGEEYELWGHSTGAPIIEYILEDPEFSEKTKQAVLLCPIGTVNMSERLLNAGIVAEFGLIAKKFPTLSSWLYSGSLPGKPGGRRDRQVNPELQETKGQVFGALFERVRQRFDYWKKSKVKEGGKIIVMSSKADLMTRSYEVFKDNPETKRKIKEINPQIETFEMPDSSHSTPLIEPERIIKQVFELQKS